MHCRSVAQLCPTFWDPMDCSTPSLRVPYHLPEFAQVHVHCIDHAIQPSQPLMPSSPLPSNFPSIRYFSNESLFASGDQNTGTSASASVLPMSIHGWFPFRSTGLISWLSKWLSGVFSSTTFQRHQFFAALPTFPFSAMNQSAVPYRVLTVVWDNRSLMGTQTPSWELML